MMYVELPLSIKTRLVTYLAISNVTTSASSSSDPPNPSTIGFDYWDEERFEGLPIVVEEMPLETSIITNNATPSDPKTKPLSLKQQQNPVLKSFTVKFVSVTFLIMFLINYSARMRTSLSLGLPSSPPRTPSLTAISAS
uniref:Uncharacterized protein n=1 Tax=Fagus sylvatica TaxID=28930 RepID=A0A2N9J4Y5_FAGSY